MRNGTKHDDAACGRHLFGRMFSTACVDAGRKSLWTSRATGFGDSHLAHDGEFLSIGYAFFAGFPQALWRQPGEACG